MAQPEPDTAYDFGFPANMLLETLRLWQLPFIISAGWWGSMADMIQPKAAVGPHPPFHEEHDQLVVPEPLETDDERCLFA